MSTGNIRQKALQQELRELVDVVGPGPLVDLLLERAFELGATDVHFDPRAEGLMVRLRVDGMMHDILMLEPANAPQVVSRLKLLANMDITERRAAQDGHISSSALKESRDVRVGSCPTIHGERLVLRLMPDASKYSTLEELGMTPEQEDAIRRGVNSPTGMILVVGPVGSGKSTTTYASLGALNDPSKSLVTIEDPVERRIDGVNQIQVDTKNGFGFVEALRGTLRQDPNVMMVGEIRDPDTAHIAARAGLTGIRVLSTLHANDTAACIDVFREFNVPPMFIADAVNCIVAQRLIRRIDPQHNEQYTPDEATLDFLGVPHEDRANVRLTRGVPHDENFNTGYAGRTGVFEVMVMTDAIRQAILNGRPSGEIQRIAESEGMVSLEDAAKRKVLAGESTIEEMHRVLMPT